MSALKKCLGLLGIGNKKDPDSSKGGLIDTEVLREQYRTQDQKDAAFYFSDANKEPLLNKGCGCFAKKEKEPVKKGPVKKGPGCMAQLKGCFAKTKGCFKGSRYMSDEEYDKLVAKILADENPKQKGLEAHCLDESQVSEVAPINFGASFWEEGGKARVGKDGYLRTSMYEDTWIFFSQTALYAYQYELCTDNGNRKEHLYEFSYKDITSISEINTKKDIVDEDGQRFSYENFLKITVANNELRIRFRNNEEAANSIKAMKTLIREKK